MLFSLSSDVSTGGSTKSIDPSLFASAATNSRSNSPADSDISGVSSIEGNIAELMTSLSLGANSQMCLGAASGQQSGGGFLGCSPELELANLQNLQAIHALKYLQQPGSAPGFGSLLQYPACSHSNSQVGEIAG